MTMASSPSPSISRVQARMFLAAEAWARSSFPMWWVSDPQQPSPSGITTSTPWRVSRRMVASLISVLSAFCAQPVIRATRLIRGPVAAWVWGLSLREGVGRRRGAMPIMARRRLSGMNRAKGRARPAAKSARRKRVG